MNKIQQLMPGHLSCSDQKKRHRAIYALRAGASVFFFFIFLPAFSQLSFSLAGDNVQSKFIEEWQQHKSVEVFCTNGSSDSIPLRFHSVLLWNDTTVMAYTHDSVGFGFPDTLFPGSNTFYLNSLLPIATTVLLDSFATSYTENGTLVAGAFKLKVQYILGDTVFGSDSLEFEVSPLSAPSLEAPYDNCNLYRNNTPSVAFTWNAVDPLPKNSVIYYFRLFTYPVPDIRWEETLMIDVDSNSDSDTAFFDMNPAWFNTEIPDSLDIEWAARNFGKIYDAYVTDINELYLPSHICEMLYEKYDAGVTRYGWTVTAFDAESEKEIGSNKGMAYPFVFNITAAASDTSYTLNKNGQYCPNNGFEDGTAFGWRFWKGARAIGSPELSIKWEKEGIHPDFHTIVGYDEDPKYGSLLYTTTHSSNLFSLRNGDLDSGGFASRESHTFTVGPNTTSISMAIAIALENAPHTRSENPVCQIKVYRKGLGFKPFINETIIVGHQGFVLDNGDGKSYRPWNCYDMDLSKRSGQTVTIEVITSDCGHGAHFGYAYIDFCVAGNATPVLALDKTVFCLADDIQATGKNSEKETMHEWTVQKCDSAGNPLSGTGHSQTFNGEAGNFGVKEFYESRGGLFECNAWYKVSLKVWNGCSVPGYASEVIYISCPPAGAAGENHCCLTKICDPITLGPTPPPSGYSYSWQALNSSCATCLNLTSIANPTYNASISSSTVQDDYLLTMTDLTTGCVATDIATIYFQLPPDPTIVTSPGDCGLTLSVSGAGVHTFDWWIAPNGGPLEFYAYAEEITVRRRPTSSVDEYYVRSTNACGQSSFDSYAIDSTNAYWGHMADIEYPNVFSSSATQAVNRKFTIYDYYKPLNEPNSYNVHAWELWIMDSEGGIWKVNQGSIAAGTCKNGDIFWDGKIDGKWAPAGEYVWFLKFTNCEYRSMNVWFADHRNVKEECLDKKPAWRLKKFWGSPYCDRWNIVDLYDSPTRGTVILMP